MNRATFYLLVMALVCAIALQSQTTLARPTGHLVKRTDADGTDDGTPDVPLDDANDEPAEKEPPATEEPTKPAKKKNKKEPATDEPAQPKKSFWGSMFGKLKSAGRGFGNHLANNQDLYTAVIQNIAAKKSTA